MAETLVQEKMAVPEIAMAEAPVAQPETPATPDSPASQTSPTPSASEESSAAANPPAAEAPKPEAEDKTESKPEVKAEAEPEKKAEPEKPAGEHKASLLSEAGKKEKAEKAAKDEKTPKVEAKPEAKAEPIKDEPLPPIEYKPFKTPKNLTFEEAALGKYTEVLGKHRASQELGQELMDMYAAEAVRHVERLQKHQWDTWNKTQEDWIEKAQSDPEFGGNRMATSLRRSASIIEQYGGSREQIKELRDALSYTGAGNHPALIRLLNNVGKALGEGKPVPAPTPQHAPQPKPGRAARLYNGS